MSVEDANERLARIEGVLSGVQSEIVTMREALMRLVRIEEQHAAIRDEVRRVHGRLDALDERLDGLDKRVEAMRGPLVWLAGIAATITAGVVSLILGRTM